MKSVVSFRRPRPMAWTVTSLACVAAVAGCEAPPLPRSTPALPDEASFPLVNRPLSRACGSLDCHGTPSRPLRLFSDRGLRGPGHVAGDGPLTAGEIRANFRSVVGLEPEALGAVVERSGEGVERLTLLRKASGEEAHKGGAVFPVGSPGDVCLVTWIAGQVAERACEEALTGAPLEPPWPPEP